MAKQLVTPPTRGRSRSDLQAALDLAHHYAHALEARDRQDHKYGLAIYLTALLALATALLAVYTF